MKSVYFYRCADGRLVMVAARSAKESRRQLPAGEWINLCVISPACEISAERFIADIQSQLARLDTLVPGVAQSYRAAVAIAVVQRFVLRTARVRMNRVRRAAFLRLRRVLPH